MKLKLTDKDKQIAVRAAKIASARDSDGFFKRVQSEVDRLENAKQTKESETVSPR